MAAVESGLRKQTVVAQLTQSPHGVLSAYKDVGEKVAAEDPEFFAHLLIWNHIKGQVRDAKVALPVLAIRATYGVPGASEYLENAQAALSLADPRTLLRGLAFARELKVPVKAVRPVVERYLKEREKIPGWWDKTVLQHKKSMKSLYYLYGIEQSERAQAVLFDQKKPYPPGSVFEVVKELSSMNPVAAAGAVVKWKIPYLIAMGALGPKLKDTDVLMSLIKSMTPAELVTNMKGLQKLGVNQVPALRATLEAALGKAATSRKVSTPTFKATEAQEAVEDPVLKAKLGALQEKQIKEVSVDGDWLIIGDKSGSMSRAIDVARHVAGTLAKSVKGEVRLAFVDTMPRSFSVTGKTYEEIVRATKAVAAGGGTALGAGLIQAVDDGFAPNGIAIVSDGGDNTHPLFANAYNLWVKRTGVEVPVYLYLCTGDHDAVTPGMKAHGYDVQVFPLSANVDYYSLPNLIKTMRVNRYSLIQEIMDTDLLTLDEVYKSRRKEAEAKEGAVTV